MTFLSDKDYEKHQHFPQFTLRPQDQAFELIMKVNTGWSGPVAEDWDCPEVYKRIGLDYFAGIMGENFGFNGVFKKIKQEENFLFFSCLLPIGIVGNKLSTAIMKTIFLFFDYEKDCHGWQTDKNPGAQILAYDMIMYGFEIYLNSQIVEFLFHNYYGQTNKSLIAEAGQIGDYFGGDGFHFVLDHGVFAMIIGAPWDLSLSGRLSDACDKRTGLCLTGHNVEQAWQIFCFFMVIVKITEQATIWHNSRTL